MSTPPERARRARARVASRVTPRVAPRFAPRFAPRTSPFHSIRFLLALVALAALVAPRSAHAAGHHAVAHGALPLDVRPAAVREVLPAL